MRNPTDQTPQSDQTSQDIIERQKENTRILRAVLEEHVAFHLSDVYKIEAFDVTRSPTPAIVHTGSKTNPFKSWMISIEAVNSRNNNIRAHFNFLFSQEEVYEILAKRRIEIDHD